MGGVGRGEGPLEEDLGIAEVRAEGGRDQGRESSRNTPSGSWPTPARTHSVLCAWRMGPVRDLACEDQLSAHHH